MPALDTLEYEHFSLDEEERPPLSLDEAIKKAREMRKLDKENFYRVEYADASETKFRVHKVPATVVYADFFSRIAKSLGKYWGRTLSR